MSDTPLWLQVALPIGTLVGGFGLGRVSKRLDRRQEQRDQTEAAKKANAPNFHIEPVVGSQYCLWNDGPADATNVTMLVDGDDGYRISDPPEQVQMRAKTGHRFLAQSTATPLPTYFEVTCDQLPQAVVVRMPR